MDKSAVFVVEDEAIVANDIRETLIGLGYTVPGIAKSGEIALAKIQQSRPNLVLMDIHLAGKMDGVETAGKIHVLYDIPVIYLTAYADKVLLERAKVTEPYGYVVKPYDERELHSVIEMALYKHQIEREIKKRDEILFAVSSAVEWLLRVSPRKPVEFQDVRIFNATDIQNILEPVGLALDAASIAIFRMLPRPAGSPAALGMIYEWGCPAYHSCLYKPEFREFTLAAMGLSRWEGQLARGEVITAAISSPDPGVQAFLNLLGVKSGIILPIFIQEHFWGVIGFFDLDERIRSPDQIEALRITANLLGAAFGQG